MKIAVAHHVVHGEGFQILIKKTSWEETALAMQFAFPRVQRYLGGEDLSRWDASQLQRKATHRTELTEIVDSMGIASSKVRRRERESANQ